ncbi:MAG: EAL domain-containing protein [Pyrinomonadaceae bacterium]
MQNITDRKRAEERLVHDAFHDALTGLPNRALFMDRLNVAFKRRKRKSGCQFAVLFLDVDCFKVINDSLGHLLGDQLLIDIAGRLASILRSNDSVARLGGDEFVLLIEDLGDADEATEIAARLQQKLSAPLHLSEHQVCASVSIGMAMASEQYQSPEEMLRDADTAMYAAKKCGRGGYQIFKPEMHERALRVLRLETDLRRAVEREEFSLFYQPIVDLQSHGTVGFEALVRWQDPARGLVSPAEFIPAAEETGLIVPLGLWVLKTACRQLVEWQRAGNCSADFWVSVNISPRQFAQPDLVEQIIAILRETGLDPQSLKLEITESAVMENIDAALALLQRLHALGLSLSIDDFGTGHSSLSYLQRFPIGTLKIDRSFVSRMAESSESAEIVRTIIALAQNLKMVVVAEGIETAEQLIQLRNLTCQLGQGYYFSRPVDAPAAGQLFHALAPEGDLLMGVAAGR